MNHDAEKTRNIISRERSTFVWLESVFEWFKKLENSDPRVVRASNGSIIGH